MPPEQFDCIEDIHAADIGLPYDLGLLYPKGSIVFDPLPAVKDKLLQLKKIRAKQPVDNKRKAGPSESK